MIILGLTGSIGMGKSTTAAMFADKGVPVHDADAVVHQLYQRGEATQVIEDAFPGSTGVDGVDRKKLGQMVLGDDEAMRKLEEIVHPLVRYAEENFLEKHMARNMQLVVLDIPLLFETAADQRVDKIVVVSAPAAVQKERVMSRPGMTEERYNAILAKQLPDIEKQARADYVIDTSLGLENARSQVASIIEDLTNK